jgi:hypothetical protein
MDNEPDGRVWNSPLRKKLHKRARQQIALTSGVTPKELLKSPSQKKSERGRMKELKRAGVTAAPPIPEDCFGCSKEPCGMKINNCSERAMVHRCLQCGQMWRHRIDPMKVWERCPICRGV